MIATPRILAILTLTTALALLACSPRAEAGDHDPVTAGSTEAVAADDEAAASKKVIPKDAAEAVFAGGCFWCVEAVFEELDGVHEVVSGYAGGSAETATYKLVASGETKHAEAVKIYYDPATISYETLLQVHFVTHDPTTLNRQGADVGPQYRSAIFFADDTEKAAAEAYIAELEASGNLTDPIVTTLEPLDAFYEAEAYHQDYVCNNPTQGYVRGVALPKVEKVRKKFEKLLKDESPITL